MEGTSQTERRKKRKRYARPNEQSFSHKKTQLLDDILKKHVLGRVVAHVWVIGTFHLASKLRHCENTKKEESRKD